MNTNHKLQSIGLTLNIDFPPGVGSWEKNAQLIGSFIEGLQQNDLWPNFQFYGKDGGRMNKIQSTSLLLDDIRSWKGQSYVLQPEKVKNYNLPDLKFMMLFNSLEIKLIMNDQAFKERRANILDKMITLVTGWNQVTMTGGWFGQQNTIHTIGFYYPWTRPPRYSPNWSGSNTLIDFISPLYHQHNEYGQPDLVKKITEAPLPIGVTRKIDSNFIMIQWANNLDDEEYLKQLCRNKEIWTTNVLNLPISPDYNEMGDLRILSFGYTVHPPLSFYDGFNGIGYKFIIAHDNGEIDEELLAEVVEWLSAGKLPDNKKLTEMNLIVPTRKAALAIHDRMGSLGINQVLYVDNEGVWWDPFPEGEWIENS